MPGVGWLWHVYCRLLAFPPSLCFYLEQAIALSRRLERMVMEGFRAGNETVLLAEESFISAHSVLFLTSAVLAWYNRANPLQSCGFKHN